MTAHHNDYIHRGEARLRGRGSGVGRASGLLVHGMVQEGVRWVFTNVALPFGTIQTGASKIARALSVVKILHNSARATIYGLSGRVLVHANHYGKVTFTNMNLE